MMFKFLHNLIMFCSEIGFDHFLGNTDNWCVSFVIFFSIQLLLIFIDS